MENYQIRYFLAVCRTLHFTGAAVEVGVSQPALTRAIQKLETELGAPLFLREGRQVHITEFGRVMQDKLERVDEARREAVRAARQFHEPSAAQLNVGIMCTIGPETVVELLDRFRMEHPGVDVKLHDVTSASSLEKVRSGALDCAFVAVHKKLPAPLKSKKLYGERMMVACAKNHRFNMMRQVNFSELDGEAYIDRLHCEFRDMFMTLIEDRKMTLTFPYASEREDWILSMVSKGMGVCLLPEFTRRQPGVYRRAVADPSLRRSIELVFMPGHEKAPGFADLLALAAQMHWPPQTAG